MLRHRPVKMRVPSTLLWSGIARVQVATSPFQRLQRSLSLLLLLLALIALVLACAGLRIPEGRTRGLPLVVIVDRTAGMGAKGGSDARLEIARERAYEVIDAAGDCPVTLLAWDGALRALCPRDSEPSAALAALDELTPADMGASDAELLRALRPWLEDERPQRVVLVSDHRPGTLEHNLLFVQAGDPAANAGIVSAGLGEPVPGRFELFAGIEFYGQGEWPVTLNVSRIEREDRETLVDARDLSIRAGLRFPVSIPVEAPGLYRLRLEARDALEADNTAWVRFAPPVRQQVALVGEAPEAVKRVVESLQTALGSVELVPAAQADPGRVAWIVADPSWKANARLPVAWLAPAAPGDVAYGEPYRADELPARPSRSFLWRGAGAPDLRLANTRDIETSRFLQPVLEAGSGAAIALIPRDGAPFSDLVIGTNLDQFAGKPAFVIFWANWFDHLRSMHDPLPTGALSTRSALEVPALSGREGFVVMRPDGEELEAAPGEPLVLDRTGVYEFEGLADTGLSRVGVSLLDADESNTMLAVAEPFSIEDIETRLADAAGDQEAEARDLDLSPWLALLAAGLLLFEWAWFRRRFVREKASREVASPARRAAA